MKFLLDRGASIETRDTRGNTPLLAAIQYNSLDAVLALISQGADIHVKDTKGCGAVHWAAYKNNANMLRLCKTYGLDFNDLDADK
jgi:ankyrin repeat protein